MTLARVFCRFSRSNLADTHPVEFTGTVATVGFPNLGLQGFAPKFARGEIASLSGAGDDARYFQISVPVQPGSWQTVTVRAGRWWMAVCKDLCVSASWRISVE
jgi:hypothetical protein